MKYNKIASILLLFTCIFVSLGIGMLCKKNAVLEGAKFKLKTFTKLKRNITNKRLDLGKAAAVVGYGKLKQKTDKAKEKKIKPPNDTINEWLNASKLALNAKNISNETKIDADIIKYRNLQKSADDLYQIVLESINYWQKIAFESSISNPINHINKIKTSTIEVLNSIDSDENKISKILNNIVLVNEPNDLKIIQNIKDTAKSKTILESEKLVKIRGLVS
jgi:hypothetical protein